MRGAREYSLCTVVVLAIALLVIAAIVVADKSVVRSALELGF